MTNTTQPPVTEAMEAAIKKLRDAENFKPTRGENFHGSYVGDRAIYHDERADHYLEVADDVADDLQAALAAAPAGEVEPVAWIVQCGSEEKRLRWESGIEIHGKSWTHTPLYTHPPQEPTDHRKAHLDELRERIKPSERGAVVVGELEADMRGLEVPFDPEESYLIDRLLADRILEALRAQADAVAEAARNLMPYLDWTIGDESPGHHPTMPSAVAALKSALAARDGGV